MHDRLRHRHGAAILEELARKYGTWTRTTCFSGIDAPGVALNMGAAALATFLNKSVPFMQHIGAIEHAKPCQKELQSAPSAPQHLWNDIEEFFEPSVKATCNECLLTAG
jgi:hypothetical protein